MAIDTANKRFSIMSMRSPILKPSIIPDGTIDDGDRYHFLNLYFGIALSGVIDAWTTQDPVSTSWSDQSADSTTWTDQTAVSTTWTDQ